MNEPLIILTGPTAVGKTELSIKLAKAVNGEIISADSMQVYKKMDIGTAKIRKDEMKGINHHLIDVYEPDYPYNVAQFKKDAKDAYMNIRSRNNIPIVCGGTGFYIQAFLNDISFDEENDDGYRSKLEEIASTENGKSVLYNMLKECDIESTESIHMNNVKRVIRALEFYHQTGQKISKHNDIERQKESPYNFAYFVLTMNRDKLYERINRRIDIMLDDGLVDEVKSLMEIGLTKNNISMQGLGYKEIYDYLSGVTTLSDAIEILKRDTRHFAKRQLTWFKREKDVVMINKDEYSTEDDILSFMLNHLKTKQII